jgi:hypothetical protein
MHPNIYLLFRLPFYDVMNRIEQRYVRLQIQWKCLPTKQTLTRRPRKSTNRTTTPLSRPAAAEDRAGCRAAVPQNATDALLVPIKLLSYL